MSQFCFGAWERNGTARFTCVGRDAVVGSVGGGGLIGAGTGAVPVGALSGGAEVGTQNPFWHNEGVDEAVGMLSETKGVGGGREGLRQSSRDSRKKPREDQATTTNTTTTTAIHQGVRFICKIA